MNRCGDRLQPEGRSGTSEWVEVIVDIWRRRRIKQQGGPLEARRNLLEQLKPLAGHRRLHDGETGGIAARACQALRDKVPMRRRGADCPVVVLKWGNARGANWVGHRG